MNFQVMKRRLSILILAACTLHLTACLMAQQHQIIRNIDTLAGNQRFDPAQFSKIDQYAMEAPETAMESMDTLASYLAKSSASDLGRVRALWRWLTSHIAYDTDKNNYSARETLRYRKGVCQGYSELFMELARRMGVRAIEVTGYTRGSGYTPGDRVTNDHAWNAVAIGGKWYLLDSTYGAGHFNGGRYYPEYREHYFLTPPAEFIYTNLPELRRWQLTPRKITRNDFERLPFYRHGYFQYGLRQLDDHQSCVISCGNELKLRFAAPSGLILTVNMRDGSGKTVSRPDIIRERGDIVIHALFEKPGDYHLVGWVSPSDRPKDYSWAFTYLVKVR
jgi:transglutaminase/protease-like cytokinesis protein 3